MKQTNEQFMALIGYDIFISNAMGILGKARVDEFRYNGKQRSLKVSLGREQDYRDVVISEQELEDRGYIMTSENIIKPMRHIEGDFVVADAS